MDGQTILLIVFVCLSVCDVLTTLQILKKGGRELNPIMKWAMDKLGTLPGLLLPKVIVLSGAVAAMLTINSVAVIWGLAVLNMVTLPVVINNIKVLKGLK